MRISMITMGSRGDVQPYIALARALATAGHDVAVAAAPAFAPLVQRAGLHHSPSTPDPRLVGDGSGPSRWLLSAATASARQMALSRLRARQYRAQTGWVAAACRHANLVIYPQWLAAEARRIQEARGLRTIPAYLAPIHPTRAHPSPFLPTWPNGVWNVASHHIAAWFGNVMRLLGASKGDAANRPAALMHGTIPTPEEICLYGYSRHLLPRPPDWPAGPVVTGPWLLDQPAGWRPPPELDLFLRRAGRVAYIGFGSMMDPDPMGLNRTLEAALAELGCRAVVGVGPGLQLRWPASESIYPIGEVPHSWLFPRVDAIVHHGGAGTAAEALRAGRPSVVVPYCGDQYFWGRRLASSGVAAAMIPRRRLTKARFVDALDQALHSPALRRRAALLGRKVRAEAGLEKAVTTIESIAH